MSTLQWLSIRTSASRIPRSDHLRSTAYLLSVLYHRTCQIGARPYKDVIQPCASRCRQLVVDLELWNCRNVSIFSHCICLLLFFLDAYSMKNRHQMWIPSEAAAKFELLAISTGYSENDQSVGISNGSEAGSEGYIFMNDR
jgi:hypothetical protein